MPLLHNQKFPFCASLWLLLTAVFLAACQQPPGPPPSPTPIQVYKYTNPAAFDLVYPIGWQQMVVQEGLLLFGEPQTVSQQAAGAAVAIIRIPPDAVRVPLADTLQHYLDNGPLAAGYTTSTAVTPISVDGRDAFATTLRADAAEGAAEEEVPAMRAYIVATQAESGAIYIFTATAPEASWPQHEDAFNLLISSVQFNE